MRARPRVHSPRFLYAAALRAHAEECRNGRSTNRWFAVSCRRPPQTGLGPPCSAATCRPSKVTRRSWFFRRETGPAAGARPVTGMWQRRRPNGAPPGMWLLGKPSGRRRTMRRSTGKGALRIRRRIANLQADFSHTSEASPILLVGRSQRYRSATNRKLIATWERAETGSKINYGSSGLAGTLHLSRVVDASSARGSGHRHPKK